MPAIRTTRLRDLLTPETVQIGLERRDKEGVLDELVDLLDGHPAVDDLEQAAGGTVEHLETVEAAASENSNQQAGLPTECRKCGENDRMEGSMVCSECTDEDPDQQAVTVSGLSQKAIDAIERRYNAEVSVVDGEASAAPTDHESAAE